MIYLASPYSHVDPFVREQRFQAVSLTAATLLRDGHLVFSPVTHGHPLVHFGLPGDWSFWEQHARWYLQHCQGVLVLMLPGWQESVGVQSEIALAQQFEKPVWYQAAPA